MAPVKKNVFIALFLLSITAYAYRFGGGPVQWVNAADYCDTSVYGRYNHADIIQADRKSVV
jgi:hypothetical protein